MGGLASRAKLQWNKQGQDHDSKTALGNAVNRVPDTKIDKEVKNKLN